jgi:alanyl-tRNA synthetase
LLAAMQKLVNKDIKQKGSNITAERLRMDFNFDRKLTEEEVKKIEDLVNEKIKDELPVIRFMMKKESAEKLGAQMEFGQKYPDEVTIYFIMKPLTREQELASQMPMEIIQKHTEAGESFHIQDQMIGIFKNNSFSMEFCGGPHVSNTREIGIGNKRFKITGQESVGAGVRRIKASLV